MVQPQVILTTRQRKVVHDAIVDLCQQRSYLLHALNVRTNHVHSVIGVVAKPERVADSLKAYSTKRLRELGLIDTDQRVWSRGRSRRYLWKPKHVEGAVNYVLFCQGDIPYEDWTG
jgi:REP element-mobilizing transposase RayT